MHEWTKSKRLIVKGPLVAWLLLVFDAAAIRGRIQYVGYQGDTRFIWSYTQSMEDQFV